MGSEFKNLVLLAWPLCLFACIILASASIEMVDGLRERRRSRRRRSGL